MKNRFESILKGLEPVKGRVFLLPLEREYLLNLSKKIGVEFPEIYTEFREIVGFTQDLLPDLLQTEDSLIDDLDYTETWCEDFFPIGTYSTEDIDYTWLLRKNSETGEIFQVDNEEEVNATPESTHKTLQSIIEQEIEDMKSGASARLNNSEKVRLFEFRIETENFEPILSLFNKIATTEWVEECWRDKYSPNVLGIEVAFLEFNKHQIMVEREKNMIDGSFTYSFEMEEPLVTIENESVAEKMKRIFDKEKVKYRFTDYGIMEYDYEE